MKVTLMKRRPENETFDEVMARHDALRPAPDPVEKMIDSFLTAIWKGEVQVPPRKRKPAGDVVAKSAVDEVEQEVQRRIDLHTELDAAE